MSTNEQPAQLPLVPGAIRQALLTDLERIEHFVAGLSVENWQRPSKASGWTIGDVVAHLNVTLGIYGRVLEAAAAGHGDNPVWKTLSGLSKRAVPAAAPAMNAVNKAIPRLIDRALAPEIVRGQFAAAVRTTRERLSRIESSDFTRPVHYMGAPWPLSFFLALMENEIALHFWDMASVLQPGTQLSEQSRATLPWFYWSGTAIMLRPPRDVSGSIQVNLTNPEIAIWWQIETDKMRTGVGQLEGAATTIQGENGAFILTVSGRMPLAEATERGLLHLEGDIKQAEEFVRSWRLV